MMPTGLSIIIVNYRSEKLILDCLRSVRQFNTQDFEIIVVNNDETSEASDIIRKEFSAVRLVDMGYNAGFARANNAGMKAASGSVYLLLNPDTLAIDDSIERCHRQLVHSAYLGAGVQQLNRDYTPQISGNFFMKGGLNHLLPIPYWGNFLRWVGYQAGTRPPNVPKAQTVEEVDWISGAFLMVKKEAVQLAGPMDEDFFLYAEEVEWCSRLRKYGKLCIYGDLRIVHLEGGTVDEQQNISDKGYYNLYDKKGLQLMVSNHLRVRKQFGVVWFLFLLLNYSWGVVVFWIGSFFHRLFLLKNPFGAWRRVGAFAKNVVRLWILAPTIIRNRSHFYKMF